MRFEILGPIRASARSREITITAGRDRILLAMLLLNANHAVPVTDLVEALWDGSVPKNTRSQLQVCVSRLRKQLTDAGVPGRTIITEPEGYRLQAAVPEVDLLEFRALVVEARAHARDGQRRRARDRYRTALALWRGPALAGIERDAVRQSAIGLDEERTRALEECIEIDLVLGSAGELVGELTDLVHRYPYRERLHAALMLALYRADRQADALAAYQRVRRTLVTELGQEPGPALRELHQRILAGDQSLRPAPPGEPDMAGSRAPAASHCLPRTVADFTGRSADLAWLVETADRADPYAPLVLAIDGMPGVGKTSLAVHAAHLLAARYPDGQLFIDLHGHSENRPVEPAAALDALLRQLGIPANLVPPELDERIARWRAELATRQVLVVLDNAAGSAQVTPLLPTGAGCLAVITSRRRLVDLDGARPRSVETLGAAEAVALLERIAGERVRDEPEAAAHVALRCGYLPLALRLAAARLAHRPRWRVQDLADRLSAPHTPLAELAAGHRTVAGAFALSYAHLTPAGQCLFRVLGLHPGVYFDAYTAAALADVQIDEAQHLLDELVDLHLVEEPRPNRYRFHDLVRAYATQLARATETEPRRAAAVERLLDYYVHAVTVASDHLETTNTRRNFRPGEPARPDLIKQQGAWGVPWLEEERANLVAAVSCAAAMGRDQDTWRLARALWPFLYSRSYLDDLFDTHRHGVAAAERLADPGAIATMRNYLASAYFRAGDHEAAIAHVHQAVGWREKAGDLVGQAIARKNLAVAYALGGHHEQVISQVERALAIARRTGDGHLLASVVVNTGAVFLTTGRYEPALWHSRCGLVLARAVGDDSLCAIALGNIGAIRARLGEPGPALRLLNAALAAKRRGQNRHGEAETLNELGAAYRALGDTGLAAAHHQRALAVMREVGDRQGEYAVHNELGRTLRAAGEIHAALESHQRALSGATRIRQRYGQARALDGIAACLRDTDPASARQHWLRALRLYRELDVPERRDVESHLATLAAAPVG